MGRSLGERDIYYGYDRYMVIDMVMIWFIINIRIYIYNTLWLFNIAMEHGPFIDDFPIKTSTYKGFSMANQMVYIL